jgi:hypothetical protein
MSPTSIAAAWMMSSRDRLNVLVPLVLIDPPR